jgi:MFS family permease
LPRGIPPARVSTAAAVVTSTGLTPVSEVPRPPAGAGMELPEQAPGDAAIGSERDGDQRWNYALHLLGGGFLFVALQFGNTRLVVPWIAHHLGVAYFVVALLVPALQLGLIGAQLGVSPLISRFALRKRPVAGFGLGLAAALLVIVGAAVGLPPALAGVVLPLCVIGFGASHGAFNVGYADLLAKTVAPPHRGSLVAYRAALGGGLTLLLSLGVLTLLPQVAGNQVMLLWLAVAGWIGVVLAYGALREVPSMPINRPITLAELRRGFGLIGAHPWLRRLLIGNALLLSVTLAIPFYAIHAATLHDPSAQNLTVFVVATGVGLISSGVLWAAWSDRGRMAGGALLALLAGALSLAVDVVEQWHVAYFHSFVFVLLTLGEQGVIQGQITYLADHAPPDDRPTMVGTTNAVMWTLGIGVALVLGAVGHLHHILTPLVLLMACNAAAALYVLLALDP